MSVKVLVDMNLSPEWVVFLKAHKIDAVHWSTIGDHGASDDVLMHWAARYGRVVFTNDLDFGAMLAIRRSKLPSVVQLRTQNTLPEYLGKTFIAVLRRYEKELKQGALIVLDDYKDRIRLLPLN